MSAMSAQSKPSSESVFKVASVITFYLVAALVMVFVNKAVLNSSPELPLLFLFIQLVLAVAFLHISALVTTQVQIPKLELETAKKLFPVVAVNILGLVFNTLCLRDVEASFFQIARGLVLPLTIIVSSLHTGSTPSIRIIIAAGCVTAGFLVGVAPSKDIPVNAAPSLISLFYGVLSSLFIALHSVLIKSSLPYCGNSTIQLAYWTNLGSAAMLVPFVFLHDEPWKAIILAKDVSWNAHIFIWGSLVTGFFGFLLCIAGLLSIKVTSPITHMFSSAAKSVIQTLLGVWLFGDFLTINRASSILIILMATMGYTWIKSKESSITPPQRETDLEAATLHRPADIEVLKPIMAEWNEEKLSEDDEE